MNYNKTCVSEHFDTDTLLKKVFNLPIQTKQYLYNVLKEDLRILSYSNINSKEKTADNKKEKSLIEENKKLKQDISFYREELNTKSQIIYDLEKMLTAKSNNSLINRLLREDPI